MSETHTHNLRITPAPAGNTEALGLDAEQVQDHPRACGKHLDITIPNSFSTGITPAPAGNTDNIVNSFEYYKDHPRACGKHSVSISFIVTPSGSPPRLRETLC